MYISKIILRNFKSYRNECFEFPAPAKGKNLVLIGGLNGYGKTTILEAIYLGLYGTDAITYLGRAGLNADKQSYGKFISKAFYANADSSDEMSVTIEIVNEKNDGYQIKRMWYFDKNRIFSESDTLFYAVKTGIKHNPLDAKRINEFLDNYFVSANLAPFFFFDGEEVKSLASNAMVEQVKISIELFLGIEFLRKLQQRLREYQNNKRKSINDVNGEKLDELTKEIDDLERVISECESKQRKLEETQTEINAAIDRVNTKMLTYSGSSGSISSIQELLENLNLATQNRDDAETKLNLTLVKKLSLNLVSSKTVSLFISQIEGELARYKWQSEREAMQPQKDKFLRNVNKIGKISPPISNEQKVQIDQIISDAWEALFLPPPPDCAENTIHTYMSKEEMSHIKEQILSSKICKEEIRSLLMKTEQYEEEIRKINNNISRLQSLSASSSMVEKLKNEHTDLISKMKETTKQLSNLENEIKGAKNTLSEKKAVFERENSRFLANMPTTSLIMKAENLYKFIGETLIPKLYPLKMSLLEKEMTLVYKQLAHKHEVEKITLDDDCHAHLYSKDGKELVYDKSAGESQLFATTLMSALANISGVFAPLIVDTPLGRLDSKHRKNIIDFWIKNNSKRQVILLCQDQEIDNALYAKLKKYVSKSYILEHSEMVDGIGETHIHEGYFGDNKNEDTF